MGAVDKVNVPQGTPSATDQSPETLGEAPEGEEFQQQEVKHGAPLLDIGGHLKEAREKAGLSTQHIAQALNLDIRQVEAMEASEWQELPCETSALGFVRNYAQHVGLDPKPLMRQLTSEFGRESPALATSPFGGAVETESSFWWAWLAVLVVVLLAVAVALWAHYGESEFGEERTQADSASVTAPVRVLAESSTATPPEPSGDGTQSINPAAAKSADVKQGARSQAASKPITGETPSNQAGGSVAAQATPPPRPAGDPTATDVSAAGARANAATGKPILYMRFKGASWVEVRDAKGHQLVYDMQYPGNEQKLFEGEEPFDIVVGNASQVQLEYRGSPVNLSQRQNANGVARISLP